MDYRKILSGNHYRTKNHVTNRFYDDFCVEDESGNYVNLNIVSCSGVIEKIECFIDNGSLEKEQKIDEEILKIELTSMGFVL